MASIASFWGSFAITSRGRVRVAAREAVERLEREVVLARSPLDLATAALKKEARAYADQQRTTRLAAVPVDSLKDVGVSGVRWAALRDSGIHTLAELAARSKEQLLTIPGVGEGTAESVLNAARKVREKVLTEPVLLPAPDTLNEAGERLVQRAAAVIRTREAVAGVAIALEQKYHTLSERLGPVLEDSSFFRWWRNGQAQRNTTSENAQQLVNRNAALLIKDNKALEQLIPTVISLAKDEQQQQKLKINISKLAIINADEIIASEILKAIG